MAVEGWKEVLFSELIEDIADGGTPSRNNSVYFGGEIPWVVIDDINPRITKTKENISKEGLDNSSAKLWPKGTVILSTGATIGEVGIADVPLTTKQGIAGIICKDNTYNLFIYHWLKSKKSYLKSIAQGSTIKEVRTPIIKKLMVSCPPLSEQNKIAEILESLDDAIAKTESVIAQTQRAKHGLLQHLLTRGIGHTKFKQTSLGEIPESWEVGKIEDLGKIVTGKTPSTSKPEYWGDGVPFITPADIQDDSEIIKSVSRSITKDGASQVKTLPSGSVLVTCIGSTIGKLGILKFLSTCNQQINAILCDSDRSAFVFEMVASKRKHIRNLAGKQAVPLINKSAFSSIVIPIPPNNEQIEISRIIERFYSCSEESRKYHDDLQKIKSGLMSDLLTGRVRVNVHAKNPKIEEPV